MNCSKCGRELRIVQEQIASNENGQPVYKSYGYCDTCGERVELENGRQAQQNSTTQQTPPPYQQQPYQQNVQWQQQPYQQPQPQYQQPPYQQNAQWQQPPYQAPYQQPVNVYVNNVANANGAGGPRAKSKWVAFFLCLFLGEIGVHKFYEGKILLGLLYLFTLGLCGIGWLVDLIILLFKPNPYYV